MVPGINVKDINREINLEEEDSIDSATVGWLGHKDLGLDNRPGL